jgi:hypothetical protein
MTTGSCERETKEVGRAQAWGKNKRSLGHFIGFFAARLFDHDYLGCHKERIELVQNRYLVYGIWYSVKFEHNKQLFRTGDDIEALSRDIYEWNVPVRAFPGWLGAHGFLYHCGHSTT